MVKCLDLRQAAQPSDNQAEEHPQLDCSCSADSGNLTYPHHETTSRPRCGHQQDDECQVRIRIRFLENEKNTVN